MRITWQRFGERLVFDGDGLEVTQGLAGSLRFAWSDFAFVSLTPALEKTGAGWGLKANRFDVGDAAASLERDGLLVLEFVVKDRRPVLAPLGWWRRMNWARRLRPMLDEEDQPRVDQSLLSVDLRWRSGLDVSRDVLLDFLAAHCHFDLVVHF